MVLDVVVWRIHCAAAASPMRVGLEYGRLLWVQTIHPRMNPLPLAASLSR